MRSGGRPWWEVAIDESGGRPWWEVAIDESGGRPWWEVAIDESQSNLSLKKTFLYKIRRNYL